MPLAFPARVPVELVLADVPGPAARHLTTTFPDHAAHREFRRVHPSFADAWSNPEQAAVVHAYVDHGPVLAPGGRRSTRPG